MFFLQMSGFPGSGKSTLAKEIAQRTQAVIIDHDVVKTALLESISDTIDPKMAGQIAYHIEWSLVDAHLSQGLSVILDSPCLYPIIIKKGTSIAAKYQATYKYVECLLKDRDVINHRLKQRDRKMSQIEHVASEEAFVRALNASQKPLESPYLIVNTSEPISTYMDRVMEYINS